MKTIKAIMAVALLACSMAGTTSAHAITYFLDVNNIGYTSTGSDFVYVTIEEDGADIKFTVDANESLFDDLANFGLQQFGFNSSNTLTAANILFPNDVSDPYDQWMVTIGPSNQTKMDGFGNFDVTVTDGGQQRKDPLMFWITGITGDTIEDYTLAGTQTDRWFGAHVTDFNSGVFAWREITGEENDCPPDPDNQDPNCQYVELTSAYFTGGDGPTAPPAGVIPVPAAAWLFGSGLIGLAGIARRRNS